MAKTWEYIMYRHRKNNGEFVACCKYFLKNIIKKFKIKINAENTKPNILAKFKGQKRFQLIHVKSNQLPSSSTVVFFLGLLSTAVPLVSLCSTCQREKV
jgi:hypothetical protein